MTSSACGRSIFCGKHVKWRKLTPAEFEKLHGYLLYRTKELKQVMVAFQDGGALAKYRRPNETVDFEGFKALLDLYLETDIPFDLCLHLFRSFIKDRTKDDEVALQTTTQTNCKTISCIVRKIIHNVKNHIFAYKYIHSFIHSFNADHLFIHSFIHSFNSFCSSLSASFDSYRSAKRNETIT
ncbi:diacylglycerol kinase beta [Trichinella spiralis]|uniref:diacylglycerol kinase beta n=1 Tax=Trichinella spiralis TaxID=6334 RepID=UPI0001EFC4AA|nr:diacylglycerol kinase beta [Trichinella spiralis]